MKTVKGNVLTILGIVAAIVAVSCGDTINGCETTVQMLGWAFVSLMLLATALVLCALGVSAEKEHFQAAGGTYKTGSRCGLSMRCIFGHTYKDRPGRLCL